MIPGTHAEIEPVDYYCPQCDSVMEFTGCVSLYCRGIRCLGCDYGCEYYGETDPEDDGECAQAMASMSKAEAYDRREVRRLVRLYDRGVWTVRLPAGDCS